jgi:hypothetical protein
LPDGKILVLDNLGGGLAGGGTQVAKLDFRDRSFERIFPNESTDASLLPVLTGIQGHLNISADGKRALVSVTTQNRVIEIELENGKVLWEYTVYHDLAPFLDSSGIDYEKSNAQFNVLGAYYVEKTGFLQ